MPDTYQEIQEQKRGVVDTPRDVYLTVKVVGVPAQHSTEKVLTWLHDLIAYANLPFECEEIEVKRG